jgi:Lamin Tail Domain
MRLALPSLSLLASLLAASAYTVTPPPVEAKIITQPAEATKAVAGSLGASNLPSQRDLLQASGGAATNLAPSTAASASTAALTISSVNYKGNVPTTEADEYVVITNKSLSPMDLSGYYVYVSTSGQQGATFTFPKDASIKPGGSVRVYTNEIHPESGGFSFKSGKALWNNKGGLAVLRDAKGGKLSEFKYKPDAAS